MFYSTAVIIAALAAATQALKFDFDSDGLVVQEGVPLTLKWSEADGPVTLTLKNGASNDLKEVEVIAAGLTGGSFTWTPEGIPSDTYAFEIKDDSEVNYTPQFSYASSTGAAVPTTAETATETETATSSEETETATGDDTTMTTMTTTGSSNSTMTESTATSTATDDDDDEDEETATATSDDDDEAEETGSADDAEETDIVNANSSGRIGASLSLVAGLAAMIALFN